MPNHKSTLQRRGLAVLSLFLLLFGLKAHALDPQSYAANSLLSSGSWAKVEVAETGMQYISDATLRSLGFSNPEKVNVYGYGGVVIPENLNSPDDLPPVPSVRVNGGVVFFGKASVGWEQKRNSATQYSHLSHPYSDNSYYFVSDFDPERKEAALSREIKSNSDPVTVFTERVVYEQDLFMAMDSGRLMLGEDFRTTPLRTFKIPLPGNIGNAMVTTAFGCKSTSSCSLLFSANGVQLPATNTDQIPYSSTKVIVTTTTIKEVENPGVMLDYTIKFNPTGNVTKAGLDYIEVEYPRTLDVSSGELYFYLSPDFDSNISIAGANDNTVVWDVTNLKNITAMPVSLSGSTLTFAAPAGYHEYIAFDARKIIREATPAGKIINQDLHSAPAPGMLVICPQEYLPAAQRLASLHKLTDGLELAIYTPEEIYNEFSSGKPDVSAFRKLLKMWYDRAEGVEGEYPAYCVIMSRPTYDQKKLSAAVKNCGYPRVPIWQSATGETETTSYSTDDYIGMLNDVAGTFNIGTAQIQVAVGRMPVKSLNEAHMAIDKLEEYLLNPDLGAWRNNVMVIADDQDKGVHLEQAESVIEAMINEGKGMDFQIEKLYLDAFTMEYTGKGATYPQAHNRLMQKWNEGLAFINYIGHANPKSWGHEYLLTWTDINAMSNKRLPYIYAATCEFLRWDADDISGAEVLWLLPSSGVIGMISPSREVLISANGVLNKSTAKYMFQEDANGLTLPVGDIMRMGKNDSNTGTNKLRYGLIGDPSMRLPFPKLNVVVDEINGINIENAEDLPVLSARSKVTLSGHIEDNQGNMLENFNGTAEISLFDAEKVITTNGNGSDGVESVYNDRKTRLFNGRTKVNAGKWATSFTMPSEIENNYSPALISMYAYTDDGKEANGATDKLYAYGYDTNAPDDFEGPKIIEFYINTPAFVNGSHVSPNPVLTAKFHDESGISVSEAGIGHSISLTLDGNVHYDDVAQYYVPDDEDTASGSLTYALGELGQGEHSLKFTVWDNANNSTTATLDFVISALWKPSIETLTTDVNPATSNVNFIVATDGSTSSMACTIEVYDIWGRTVWSGMAPAWSNSANRATLGWNLCDFAGARVPGGVYLYRATVKTDAGATVTKTKKLIVTDL